MFPDLSGDILGETRSTHLAVLSVDRTYMDVNANHSAEKDFFLFDLLRSAGVQPKDTDGIDSDKIMSLFVMLYVDLLSLSSTRPSEVKNVELTNEDPFEMKSVFK